MVICGRPSGVVTPLLMPNSAGFSGVLGMKVMWMRLNPNRASFTSCVPNTCVWLRVPICRVDSRVSPNPGIVLPCSVGSPRASGWNA